MKKYFCALVVALAAVLFMGCKYELELHDDSGRIAAKATVDTFDGVVSWLALDDSINFTGYKIIMGDTVSDVDADKAVVLYKGPNSIYRVTFDSLVSLDDEDKEIEMENIVITDLISGEVVLCYNDFTGIQLDAD